jgi:hypothetical protein
MQKILGFLSCLELRLGYYFKKACSGPVVVTERPGAVMNHLAGILFKVDFMEVYLLNLSAALIFKIAVPAEGVGKLGDLVVLS